MNRSRYQSSRHINHKRRDDNDNDSDYQHLEYELQKSFGRQKNIAVTEDKKSNRAVLKIYGTIEEPAEYVEELEKLDALSKEFDVLEIILNSPGGSLNTTVELFSLIKQYNHVITIGKGEVASGAFMLWTLGDIRVATDYSMYMAHRESYGMYGKTVEHRDAAVAFGQVYEEMFQTCFGDLLTDTEKLIAERSEAWVSYKDLLERDRVISYKEYTNPTNQFGMLEMFVLEDGKMFLFDKTSDTFRTVKVKFTDEFLPSMSEYLYGIAKIESLPKQEKQKNVKIKPTLVRAAKKEKK